MHAADGPRRMAAGAHRSPLERGAGCAPTCDGQLREGFLRGSAQARGPGNLHLGGRRRHSPARVRRLPIGRHGRRCRRLPASRLRQRLSPHPGTGNPGSDRPSTSRSRPVLPVRDGGGTGMELRPERCRTRHTARPQRARCPERPTVRRRRRTRAVLFPTPHASTSPQSDTFSWSRTRPPYAFGLKEHIARHPITSSGPVTAV